MAALSQARIKEKMRLFIVAVLAAVGVAGTLLPLIPSGSPLVRGWEFPRVQIAALLTFSAILLPIVAGEWTWEVLGAEALLLSCLAWQIFSMLPYTPLSPAQVQFAEPSTDDAGIRLVASNVLESNRDASRLIRLARTLKPDILLLLETDAWWDERIRELNDLYPTIVACPKSNTYGMHLLSKLEVVESEIRFLVEPDIPSIRAVVRTKSGVPVLLICVHPRPPIFVSADKRDAELLLVGRELQAETLPSIVAGDLNDVAWSKSTRLFQKVSGLLDPRIGRGAFNTFNARGPSFLRWPLDHVFVAKEFQLLEIRVLEDIGSDHFPFYVNLRYAPHGRNERPPQPSRQESERADEKIGNGSRT